MEPGKLQTAADTLYDLAIDLGTPEEQAKTLARSGVALYEMALPEIAKAHQARVDEWVDLRRKERREAEVKPARSRYMMGGEIYDNPMTSSDPSLYCPHEDVSSRIRERVERLKGIL